MIWCCMILHGDWCCMVLSGKVRTCETGPAMSKPLDESGHGRADGEGQPGHDAAGKGGLGTGDLKVLLLLVFFVQLSLSWWAEVA